MSDSDGRTRQRVTVCDTHDTLRTASELFNEYRVHYGEPRGEDGRVYEWLSDMVEDGKLRVFIANVDGKAVGLATAHEIPASLAMSTFWQLRDLYVVPEGRRSGVGRGLVLAVTEAAEQAGAIRLSLTTEPENSAALALYQKLGFKRVHGLTSLSLALPRLPSIQSS